MNKVLAIRLVAAARSSILGRSVAFRRTLSSVPTTSDDKGSAVEERDAEMLEKIDVEKLPRAQKRFVAEFEQANEERVKEMFRKNYRNIGALVLISSAILAIYLYTIYAVKQETFLEEIDEEVEQELQSKPVQKTS